MKNVVLLGSTGSIGTQALDVIRAERLQADLTLLQAFRATWLFRLLRRFKNWLKPPAHQAPPLDGTVLRALDNPIHATGGLTILEGTLAPGGAVVKSAGFETGVFEGTARVFDRERAAMDALKGRRYLVFGVAASDGIENFRHLAQAELRASFAGHRARTQESDPLHETLQDFLDDPVAAAGQDRLER